MKKILRNGSIALEYAVLIAILAMALITLSGYIKRAISGKWRDVGDSFGYGRQWEVK